MARFYIPLFDDPYPAAPVQVTGFRYDSALVLMRLKDAVKTRQGEDAKYVVAGDYKAHWIDGQGKAHKIVVPRGMMTDLTSVPRPFRGIINRVGPWLEAAIVHDWLCIAWRTLDGQGTAARRKFSDDVMFAAMQAARVWGRKWLIYGAIRAASPFVLDDVDPATQTDLYLDLSAPDILAQLPPGIGPIDDGTDFA